MGRLLTGCSPGGTYVSRVEKTWKVSGKPNPSMVSMHRHFIRKDLSLVRLDASDGFHMDNTSDDPGPCCGIALGLGNWDQLVRLARLGRGLGWGRGLIWLGALTEKSLGPESQNELSMLPVGRTGSGFFPPSSTWKCLFGDRCRIEVESTAYRLRATHDWSGEPVVHHTAWANVPGWVVNSLRPGSHSHGSGSVLEQARTGHGKRRRNSSTWHPMLLTQVPNLRRRFNQVPTQGSMSARPVAAWLINIIAGPSGRRPWAPLRTYGRGRR